MGARDRSGPVKFLRLQADRNCADGAPDAFDGEAASQPLGAQHCFAIEMGLDDAFAASQNGPPVAFGLTWPSAVALDCDPNTVGLSDQIVTGCQPIHAPNSFTTNPLCPAPNNLYTLPNPGLPFDLDWPPIRCVLARTTASGNVATAGFNTRMFQDSTSPLCPADAPGFVAGGNWATENNADDTWVYPNLNTNDPRVVLIPTLTSMGLGNGNETVPIDSIVRFYVSGWGRIAGNGSLTMEDPCPGNTPPSDLTVLTSGAFVFWGHLIP